MADEKYPGARRDAAQRRTNSAVAIAVLAIVAGIAAYAYWQSRPPPPPPSAPTAAVPPPAATDAGEDASELPPPPGGVTAKTELERAAGGLSNRPEWASWLHEPHLVARLVAATHRVAEGERPRPVLTFLVPNKDFSAVTGDGKLVQAPESTARYDAITELVTAIDPRQAAEAYARLSPYFQAAYREISHPGERFTPMLVQAIHELLTTPVPAGEPALVKSGAQYSYQDFQLEKLPPAQKQLLRMGVANARKVQRWLTDFERALQR